MMDTGQWKLMIILLMMLMNHPQCFGQSDRNPKLLYIMLDGFRWDYLEKQEPGAFPAFQKFLKEGVRARWTNPIFPANSFPSWTTLATGLYSENHNILGNYFYDAASEEIFGLYSSRTTGKTKWWTSEPIWTTAEKAGLKTAQIYWARCDVPIDRLTTHHCQPYIDEDYWLQNFLKGIYQGLDKFKEGYDFVQVYSYEPDISGHYYGPESSDVLESLRNIDSVLDILLDELVDRNLERTVNIVIVSDHGMEYITRESFEFHDVDQYLNVNLVEKLTGQGGSMGVYVLPQNIEQVFQQLSTIPGMAVYKKQDIPERFHYKHGKYAPDILVVAQKGHLITGSASVLQIPGRNSGFGGGKHGLSIDDPSMRGIFFAKGPAFRRNLVINPIDLVDVYQVLTTVLQVPPRPHNGTWGHVAPAFKRQPRRQTKTPAGDKPTDAKEVDGENSASVTTLSYVFLLFFIVVMGYTATYT